MNTEYKNFSVLFVSLVYPADCQQVAMPALILYSAQQPARNKFVEHKF